MCVCRELGIVLENQVEQNLDNEVEAGTVMPFPYGSYCIIQGIVLRTTFQHASTGVINIPNTVQLYSGVGGYQSVEEAPSGFPAL